MKVNLTAENLRQAAEIAEEIEEKQKQINALLGGESIAPEAKEVTTTGRHLSAEAKARISAAQTRRWAKYHKEQKNKETAKV